MPTRNAEYLRISLAIKDLDLLGDGVVNLPLPDGDIKWIQSLIFKAISYLEDRRLSVSPSRVNRESPR